MKKIPVLLLLGITMFSCSRKNDPRPETKDPPPCHLISLKTGNVPGQPSFFFSYSFEYDVITGRMTSFTDGVYQYQLTYKADSIILNYSATMALPEGIVQRQILIKDKKSSLPAYRLGTGFYSITQPPRLVDSTIFVMDNAGKVVKTVSYKYGTNQALDSTTYKYDAQGNISELESPGTKITYTYFDKKFSPATLFIGLSLPLQYLPGFPMAYNATNNIKHIKAAYTPAGTQETNYTDIGYTYVFDKWNMVDTIYADYKLTGGESGRTFYKAGYKCN